ncbi:MAG: dehydrogenase E1 component subunit alpha/beta [Chlamydiia bacterium]|nr:dehydrogenase E1 component subunit alpha/beta [Chlamydiia bacterium]
MTTKEAPISDLLKLSRANFAKRTLEVMLQTRMMDDKMAKLVRQNKGGTFFLSAAGHEMIGAICALTLTPEKDWGLPYYRDRAFALGLGCTASDLFGSFLARATKHHSGGRMMPEHYSHKRLRIPCQSSVVGSQMLQSAGVAKAIQLAGRDEVVYVSAGDGATSQGDFHEALNFACLHKLPLIFVIQDNGWAISVPVAEQTAGGSIDAIVKGYAGLSVHNVDGTSFVDTQAACQTAVRKARSGDGPSLIVAKVPRIGPHSSSDDPKKYKSQDHVDEDQKRDPLPRFENWLIEQEIMTPAEIEALRAKIFQDIEDAAVQADQIPHPCPKTARSKVFKPFEIDETPESGQNPAVVMVDALNHALDEEMTADKSIVIFGQDVAKGKGGVFGVTRELTAKHGEARCFNSPLAESTIVGIATGMAMEGTFKPVAEVQFADYLWTGINQLFNELSSIYYRSNGEWNCPAVIRMPCGGYIQGGPYHSQNIEAFLAHCPGLKIAIPSNAADAKRLLKAAIRDPNPVVFLEHKALYRQRVFAARPEPTETEVLPLGKAKIVREGQDVTLVAWGMTVCMASEVAMQLEKSGISVEIIDLRTIVPLDIDTVLQSVQKTGKVLIAHEAAKFGGFGAEIAARIASDAFTFLDAPVQRLASADCPVPYAKGLEDAVLLQRHDLEEALRQLAEY